MLNAKICLAVIHASVPLAFTVMGRLVEKEIVLISSVRKTSNVSQPESLTVNARTDLVVISPENALT